MPRYPAVLVLIIHALTTSAQNTGIGTSTPLQKLDVNGAIKIGSTTVNEPGSIRYQNNKFEGGNGSTWNELAGLPSKAIILAQEPDTAFLKTQGFAFVRSSDLWDTSYFNVPVNMPGAWNNGFPISGGTVPALFNGSAETVQYNGQYIYYGSDGFLYSYNTNTDLWQQLPNVSPLGQRTGFGMSIINNEIFITGGWRFVNPNFVIYSTAAKYNLTTNAWTSIANMPVTNCYHATVAAGTDLYFINGANSFSGSAFVFQKKLYRYNSLTNTWSIDLATPGTPDYLAPYNATGRNGKYLYTSFTLYSSSGSQYINLVEFDPATQTVTNLTPGPPWPNTIVYQFRNARPLVTAADKVLVAATLPDSTDINYNPGNPPATATSISSLYEVTISTGVSVQLNTCKTTYDDILNWQYFGSDQLVYIRVGSGGYYTFNRGGSESCNVVLRRRGYWSYMKKI
jgi:hypothetical protein